MLAILSTKLAGRYQALFVSDQFSHRPPPGADQVEAAAGVGACDEAGGGAGNDTGTDPAVAGPDPGT